MKKAVLDASAIIAFVRRERGHEIVQQWLTDATICAVNYAEALQKLADTDHERMLMHAAIANLRVAIIDFDRQLADCVASIYPHTTKGISLADRTCLALGMEPGAPVVTGDHKWSELPLDLEVIQFREPNN